MRTTLRRLVVSVVVVTAVLLAGVAAANLEFDRRVDGIPRVDVSGLAQPAGSAQNFLLIGSDSREFVGDDPGAAEAFGTTADTGPDRADTIMIVHAGPDGGFAVSVPRDLWVDVPGVGGSKINAAFHDGPSGVVETITANFGVPIHHYLEVDFAGFAGIVDAVGGVRVFFEAPTRDTVSGLDVPLAPACIVLDGDQALAYVRSRSYQEFVGGEWVYDPTGDIGRMARQQVFMRRLAADVIQTAVGEPLRARDVADASVDLLTADSTLTPDDVRALMRTFRGVDPNDPGSLEMLTLPWTTGPSQAGQSVLYLEEPAASEVFARLRDPGRVRPAGETLHPSSVAVRVLNGTDTAGLARESLDALSAAGFVPAGTGDAASKPVGETEVRYRPGAEAHARTVLDHLGGVGRLIEDAAVLDADVVVVLGVDFAAVVPPPAGSSATPDDGRDGGEEAAAPAGDAPAATVGEEPAAAPEPVPGC